MKKFSLIIVFDETKQNILMVHRSTEPYKGLYNFPGGKIENGEDHLASAYRELWEETGIERKDIELVQFMDYTWHFIDMQMYVYIGKLKNQIILQEEIHSLHWFDIHENFFDMTRFAGEGNIGHMMELYFQNEDII